jgi:GAF domain-containing protein
MLKDDVLVGVFFIYRQEVRPFTEKQIALLQNFAAQAVIAIENARLLNELRQSLEQQTATADVLRVISASPGQLRSVFDAILENATRICEAKFGILNLYGDGGLCMGAMHNVPSAFADWLQSQRGAYQPIPGSPPDRVIRTKKVSHVLDNAAEAAPGRAATLGGARTTVCVPMLKDDELIGTITIFRQEVRPFTDEQIALLANFANQAVIAIENARLLNELRESLEQQTATADVLRIISSSPGELEPVFQAMLANATRICEAKFGILYRCEGDALRTVAMHDVPQPFVEVRRSNPIIRPNPYTTLGRAMTTKQPLQIANILEELDPLDDRAAQLPKLADARTVLAVPMLKETELVGAFLIYRIEVRPFTEKQIALVQSFAAQAVIAIENSRLLNELQQSLEQQTATADVLRVISSSPGELHPVFNSLLENAVRLCDAKFGSLFLYDGASFHTAALQNAPEAYRDYQWQRGSFVPPRGTSLDRIVKTKNVVYILDDAAEPVPSSPGRLAGARSHLAVPMFKDGALVGAITIYHQVVRPFTDKQIELLQNFASQAVIAIENARLLNELRQRTTDLSESLEQQTATSEVLRVISSSPGELKTVFQAMLANAVRICEAKFGNLLLVQGDTYQFMASYGAPEAYLEARRQRPVIRPKPGSDLDLIRRDKKPTHIADMMVGGAAASEIVELAGARTFLNVPMLKDNELIGVIGIYRQEVRLFTDKQVELLSNFAAQAVIAIENARLLKELRERTEEVVKLNQQLERRVADQVGEIERMGRLRRFLPPQVADLIVASGTEKQLESHRREITALFCDLRGFTGFSASSDPEDVMALLRDYHAAIGEIIIKYSGTLERYAGDGVMVVFNDPVPVDNPALQAVLMALEMRAAIGSLIDKWQRLGHEIGFGIGIAHGFATLGTIGFESRYDYAAIGTVSNVASRLCDEAKPGQILISPRVLLAVEKAVTVEPVGEFALKGIRRPMAAYNVLASSPSKPD